MDQGTCNIPECDKPRKNRDRVCAMHRARITRHGSPDGKAVRKDLATRVFEKIECGDGCWVWRGSHSPDGYAQLRTATENIMVHRFVYEAHNDPIPKGMHIDHMCHNPGCVRPDHLRCITPAQNVQNFTTPLRSHNTSGYRGVTLHKHSGLWHATATRDGHTYSGGYHRTAAAAGEAARKLRMEIHSHNDLDRMTGSAGHVARVSSTRGVA